MDTRDICAEEIRFDAKNDVGFCFLGWVSGRALECIQLQKATTQVIHSRHEGSSIAYLSLTHCTSTDDRCIENMVSMHRLLEQVEEPVHAYAC